MMYYQLIKRDSRYGWGLLGDAVYINNDSMQETDILHAHNIATRIVDNHKPSTPVVLLDGLSFEYVMQQAQRAAMGVGFDGFPAPDAIDLMGRLVGMNPLEAGPGGDKDRAYRFEAPMSETGIRVLVREWRKWTTIPAEAR